MGNPHTEITTKLFNGFNNGRDTSEGVGGRPAPDEYYPDPTVDMYAPTTAPQLSPYEYLLSRINQIDDTINKLIARLYELEHPHIPGSMVPHPPPPPPDRIIKEGGTVQLPPDLDPTYVKTTITGPPAH